MLMRMSATQGLALLAAAAALPLPLFAADSYQLDPFEQATAGFAACPTVAPPTLAPEQMRAQAHSRVERGTSCCLAGTCECGGPYKHDAEINDRVVEAIRVDKRFRDTAVWVTTTRGFVTLRGCVRNPAQKNALAQVVKRQTGVTLVWNEVAIGRKGK